MKRVLVLFWNVLLTVPQMMKILVMIQLCAMKLTVKLTVKMAVLKAAKAMDVLGNKEARVWVSMVKAMVPERACKIIDQAIQMHGATGISHWTPLAEMYQDVRHLRFADGPDEVHWMVVGRHELTL